MHEWSIVESVVKEIIKQTEKHKIKKLDKVCMSIGRDSNFEPEHFRFCFQLLSKGTPLENVELELKENDSSGVVINSIEGQSCDE